MAEYFDQRGNVFLAMTGRDGSLEYAFYRAPELTLKTAPKRATSSNGSSETFFEACLEVRPLEAMVLGAVTFDLDGAH